MTDVKHSVVAARDGIIERVVSRTPQSKREFERAKQVLPGGTTRSNLHMKPYPISIDRAEGATLTDLDGNQYIDLGNDYAVAMFGHSNKQIAAAISKQFESGTSYGARTSHETRLAEVLIDRFPSIEALRFCNSGTEANLYAFLLARAATGRTTFVMMDGGYHGGALSKAMNDDRFFAPFDVITVPYNDEEALKALFAEKGDQIACLAMELMLNSGGCISATQSFAKLAETLCAKTGALLLVDEVMTSRLHPGGLQAHYGVTPDLTTLGKMIGGGFTVGAFGGRADLMAHMDQFKAGAIAHNGSFNNNVMTMVAGRVAMTDVITPERIATANQLGDELREKLNALCADYQAPIRFAGWGSVLALHLGTEPPHQFATPPLSAEIRSLFHAFALDKGYWIAARGMLSLSVETTRNHCDGFADCFKEFLETQGESLLVARRVLDEQEVAA